MDAAESSDRPFSEQRQHIALRLVPERTAVIVVDMINEFLEDGGLMVMASGRALYEPIQQLVDAAHRVGSTVIWLRDEHEAHNPELRKRILHCLPGSWGTQLVAALRPGPTDLILTKSSYNGFFRTPLHERLQERSITTLIVVGVVTNICVRSTVHDAFFLGYDVIVPEQCVAATSEREQASSLYDIDTHYGSVTSLDHVLSLLAEHEVAL